MKILATNLEAWQWIAIIGAIVVALILIAAICVWCYKRTKGTKNTAKNSDASLGSSGKKKTSEVAAKSADKETAKPAAKETAKPVEKPVEKPAATKEAAKVYHISKRKEDNKWQIKAEGASRAIKLFNTQAEAIAYAKQLAQNQEARIMIHKGDGSFRKLTY